MSECDYGWCRDVRRDEEVRAAEDAADLDLYCSGTIDEMTHVIERGGR